MASNILMSSGSCTTLAVLQHQLLNQQLDNLRRKVCMELLTIQCNRRVHDRVVLNTTDQWLTGTNLGRPEHLPVPHGNTYIHIHTYSKKC
jgi:hypothetical protein